MYNLGNIAVVENFYAVAQDLTSDDILYVLDQIDTMSIEVSADSTDIVDKNGRIIYQKYAAKTGVLNSTSALLSPMVMNAGSGSDVEYASTAASIQAPKIILVAPGSKTDISDAITPKDVKVIGLYGNGANYKMSLGSEASFKDATFVVDGTELTVPGSETDAPIQYLVKYERNMTEGVKLTNNADKVADVVKLTIYSAIVDPCDKKTKPAFIVAPSFQADPNMTINFDVENQEIDFNGNLLPSFCDTNKILYYIYMPSEDCVLTATVTNTTTSV